MLHLTSWCELCGSSETVDGEGVAQVVRQVLDWALACDNGLDEESEHGEHSLHTARFVKTVIILWQYTTLSFNAKDRLKLSRLKMPQSYQIETSNIVTWSYTCTPEGRCQVSLNLLYEKCRG